MVPGFITERQAEAINRRTGEVVVTYSRPEYGTGDNYIEITRSGPIPVENHKTRKAKAADQRRLSRRALRTKRRMER